MKIVRDKISIRELNEMAQNMFGNLVKAVVDVEKKIMSVGGELHADAEAILLEEDSQQKNLWGINIYPLLPQKDWIEFDSIINLKPSQGNRSRSVEDLKIQEKITGIVTSLIENENYT